MLHTYVRGARKRMMAVPQVMFGRMNIYLASMNGVPAVKPFMHVNLSKTPRLRRNKGTSSRFCSHKRRSMTFDVHLMRMTVLENNYKVTMCNGHAMAAVCVARAQNR